MYCKNCGKQISDDSKFCQYCGSEQDHVHEEDKIDDQVIEDIVNGVETENSKSEDVVVEVAETEPEVIEGKSTETRKEWYYVENREPKGPFSEETMYSMIMKGLLNEGSYVWKEDMSDWAHLRDTELIKYYKQDKVEPEIKHEETIESENDEIDKIEWYYVYKDNTMGPYNESEMIEKIKSGVIKSNTFVWKTGMDDWIHLSDSELSGHKFEVAIVNENAQNQQYSSNYSSNNSYVNQRGIGLSVLLTIVTCGIYGIYWLYCMASDLNKLDGDNKTSPGMVILLSIVTCGIYLLYFLYKAGQRISYLTYPDGMHPNNDGVIMLVLGIFGLSIVSYCILQSNINEYVRRS